MAKRKITPVGGPIGRTRPGRPLWMDTAKAAALVAVGRARDWIEPVEPKPETKKNRRISPRTGKPVRRYRRRDMEPEN